MMGTADPTKKSYCSDSKAPSPKDDTFVDPGIGCGKDLKGIEDSDKVRRKGARQELRSCHQSRCGDILYFSSSQERNSYRTRQHRWRYRKNMGITALNPRFSLKTQTSSHCPNSKEEALAPQ